MFTRLSDGVLFRSRPVITHLGENLFHGGGQCHLSTISPYNRAPNLLKVPRRVFYKKCRLEVTSKVSTPQLPLGGLWPGQLRSCLLVKNFLAAANSELHTKCALLPNCCEAGRLAKPKRVWLMHTRKLVRFVCCDTLLHKKSSILKAGPGYNT